ncbi:S8 family serine peptidase [Conexibacter sp. JD483]|uniref:S8 family serine peptidase n=1 Tax=unclassified Conexibacter TaxID=2627773 RepID=UPI00271E958E|nr:MULTISPECIES: S8 family serine peptidase [unclassified Conexibacter]MDO8188943.1 S8 family serine peptidase [Conexibacter sp. CPCC 205706]MDO8201742.1 S8 family serine peptidase [Conexibacter sp. CPCC 205762]MDR9371425.1 S8 family serine peptidase [Conexibacter sp. JD483]
MVVRLAGKASALLALSALALMPSAARATTPTAAAAPAAQRIVVAFTPDATATDRAGARDDAGAPLLATLGRTRFQLLQSDPATQQVTLDQLRADPAVLAAEPDRLLQTSALPNDPLLPYQWGLANDGSGVLGQLATPGADAAVTTAWEATSGSADVVVADIDSGYRIDHPELAPVTWTNPGEVDNGRDDDGNGIVDDLHGADFVGDNANANPLPVDGDPTDTDVSERAGHGIHTAGIIAAAAGNGVGVSGVAPGVRLMPLRVCAPSTQGCPLSAIVKAVNYAGAKGARVANMSLGSRGEDAVMRAALAANPRTLYVAAAGNDGLDVEGSGSTPCGEDPTRSGVPGAIDNVVCVAASDQLDLLASFSNRGATSVDLAAPGTEILSLYPYGSVWSERFEGDGLAGWTAGPQGGFARSSETGSWSASDSPGAAPPSGAGGAVALSSTSPPLTLPAGTATCTLRASARVVNGGGAANLAATLTVIRNGSAITPSWRGTTSSDLRIELGLGTRGRGGDQLRVKLGYEVPAGVVPQAGDGVWFDDLDLSCMQPPGRTNGYGYMSGTSMATPFVAGAAALLFSLRPQASVAQVRAALLAGVTRLPAFSGVTTSGGRLNVPGAMSALAAVVPGPPLPAGFGTVSPPPVQQTPAAPEPPAPPATPPTPTPLPTPIERQETAPSTRPLVRCVVPKLTGRTLAQARTLLRRAHCAVGRVGRPRGRAARALIVKTSSPRAGSRRVSGMRVTLTLQQRPKAKATKPAARR